MGARLSWKSPSNYCTEKVGRKTAYLQNWNVCKCGFCRCLHAQWQKLQSPSAGLEYVFPSGDWALLDPISRSCVTSTPSSFPLKKPALRLYLPFVLWRWIRFPKISAKPGLGVLSESAKCGVAALLVNASGSVSFLSYTPTIMFCLPGCGQVCECSLAA